jgi:hypothetical protein
MSRTTKKDNTVKQWNYLEASATINYIRTHLAEMRTAVIRLKHLFFEADFNRSELAKNPEVSSLVEFGKKTYAELDKIGITVYDKTYRGIALYPFTVFYENSKGRTTREAFYVYRDSRNTIDTYAFKDDLESSQDVSMCEKPVPMSWQIAKSEPVIDAHEKK